MYIRKVEMLAYAGLFQTLKYIVVFQLHECRRANSREFVSPEVQSNYRGALLMRKRPPSRTPVGP
jgi:hypothetical protein